MKIYLDIDGVARNLALTVLGRDPEIWDERDKHGDTLIEAVNKDPALCLFAPPFSEIVEFINEHWKGRIKYFLSSQPKTWQRKTDAWLTTYIDRPYEVIYTGDSNDKLSRMKPGDFIIDDSPCFGSYKQVILIDRLYNQNIDADLRVHNLEELEAIIELLEAVDKMMGGL